MQLPEHLLKSLESVKGFDKEAFDRVHQSGEQVTSIRINPAKQAEINIRNSKIPWAEFGYYLESRPSFTFDPLFHAGCYYVQEASSMFLEQAIKQTVDLTKPLKVLDLCASPGGKSTHIQSLISKESLLVSNDVIRSRAGVLKDNIIKWGCENVVVTNNDPKDFSKLHGYFDVIVVDAPCSGSGLFRKEPEAIHEWSENNVQLCSQRQQRILADILPALKDEGVLIYSTCSYSKEEDEGITAWLLDNLPVTHYPLFIDNDWGIVESSGGYRFWPDKIKGEGFFLACFKKNNSTNEIKIKSKKNPESVSANEISVIKNWVDTSGFRFIKNQQTVYAWPEIFANDFSFLLEQLRFVYSGILVGEVIRDKLVPDHALALSLLSVATISKVSLSFEDAIKYLQKKDMNIPVASKGWSLACYENQPLGWMNILPGRVNNYYPKSLRILKDRPD